MTREYTIKEEGYVFMYVSNENATLVDVYFDDVVMTHTKSNLVQYNEYYPFGLQTANSWTRESNTGNNFLANGGTELNTTSNLYDLQYRNYDPILGRMNQVDPMATKYASLTPYNFSFNDPVMFNDRNGADPLDYWKQYGKAVEKKNNAEQRNKEGFRSTNNNRYMYGVVGDDDLFPKYGPGGSNSLGGPIWDAVTKKYYTQDFKNGVFGLYIKRTFIDYSTEDKATNTMAGILLLYEWHAGSLNHYRAMSNPITQKIHQGQQAFMDNPFGGGLMAFLSGGGLMGGGAIAGRTSSGLKMLQPLVVRGGSALIQSANIGGRTIVNNLMQTGVRNALINLSVQSIFNGKNIDRADVLISAISGNYFMFSSLASALVDNTSSFGFQTAADKSIYQTSVDAATGMAFGFAAGQAGKAIGPNGGAGIVDFTINLYGGLTNWALAPPSKKP